MARQRGSKRRQRYPCGGKVKRRKMSGGGKVMRGAGAARRGKKFTRAG